MRALLGMQLLHIFPVRTGVALAVLQNPQNHEEPRGKQGSEHGTDPVDPMISREVAADHGWAEAACWIQ